MIPLYDWNAAAAAALPPTVELQDGTLPFLRRRLPRGLRGAMLDLLARVGVASVDLGPADDWSLEAAAEAGARGLEPVVQPTRAWRAGALAELGVVVRVPPALLEEGVAVELAVPRSGAEEAIRRAGALGAGRLLVQGGPRLADPAAVAAHVGRLAQVAREHGLPLGWSERERDEMGVARALAALRAGAVRLRGTVLGVGGGVPLDLLIVNLHLHGLSRGDSRALKELAELVAEVSGRPIPHDWPVLGRDAFRTATGVHAAAVIKAGDRGDAWHADRVYSGVPAGDFGCRQAIEVGPMSGRWNVVHWLRQEGVEATPERVDRLLERAKAADRTLAPDELREVLDEAPPTPRRLMEARFGYISSRAIGAALEIDLFTAVARGATDVEALREATGCSARGLRFLLDALVAQDLVRRDGPLLRLAPDARTFLVADSPGYVGGMILQADTMWNRWSRLEQAVREGAPPGAGIESEEDGGRYFAAFVEGLHNQNTPAARAAAAVVDPGRDVLDLGAGSAVWSLPFAAQEGVRVTAVDREEVLERVTRPWTRRAGVEDRYRFLAASYRDLDLGEGRYDLIILGHVLHFESRARALDLLRRCRRALRPGGRLLVAEMLPDDARRSDLYGLLFGLHMLMLTEEGETYTRRELVDLVDEAGLWLADWLEVPGPYPLMLATRSSANCRKTRSVAGLGRTSGPISRRPSENLCHARSSSPREPVAP